MYKIKKLVCTLLAVCIISTTLAQPVQAFTGAEGAILGGGAGLASISLTAPQVALVVAAGFGLVVAVENADKLAEGMTSALNTAAAGVDAGAETLSQWLETAKKGSIAIASAPAWIAAAIKGWINDLYNAEGVTSVMGSPIAAHVSAGSPVNSVDFWGSSSPYVYTDDVDIFRASYTNQSGSTFKYTILYVALSNKDFYRIVNGVNKKVTGNFGGVYYDSVRISGSPDVNTSFDYDAKAIQAAQSLPDISTFRNPSLPANYPLNVDTWYLHVLTAWKEGTLVIPTGSICPDAKVGGIGAALEEGKSIDAVNMPDLDVAGSKSICPDGVLDGSIPIADTVADVIVGLTDGTLSWSDYVSDVAVGTPTISVPVEGTETGVIDYPITDTGVSDVPIEETPDQPGEVEVPEGLAPYTVQLKDFFPFCIPFDIVDFVGVLCADPVAPSFEWTFTQYSGQKDTLEIDLAPFDQVAQLLRNMELLLFIIGLAFLTRNLIRG